MADDFLSDRCSKPYPIIATVKLCVVASNEVGSQNPDGTCRGRHIQAPEGDGADIPFDLWLLEPQRSQSVSHNNYHYHYIIYVLWWKKLYGSREVALEIEKCLFCFFCFFCDLKMMAFQ